LAFRGAIAADATFWLAYFRYALAQNWLEQPVEPELSAGLYRHRNVLPERDRLLVEAWETVDSLPLQLQRYREVTRRFPDYWPGWFVLGDRLFHAGIILGHDWRETQSVFNHAIVLNPRLRPALQHMWQNSFGKDPLESGRVLSRLREIWRPDTSPDPWHSHVRLLVRVMQTVSDAGGVTDSASRAMVDSLARELAGRFKRDPDESEVAAWSPFLQTGYPAAQIELNRRILKLGLEGTPAAAQLRGIAWAWAARGEWDSAFATMHEALRLVPRTTNHEELTPLDDYGLAVLGGWLGAVGSREAEARRPAAWAGVQRLESGDQKAFSLWMLAWLDGLSAFTRGDKPALHRARKDAGRSGNPSGGSLDRSLAAFDRALSGDRATAGRELASTQWCIVTTSCAYRIMPNIATDRLAAATWLLEAGDTAQAVRLLVWYESLQGGWDASYSHVTTALAYLLRARIEEAQGDAGSARTHYAYFLRRYDAPIPSQRHLVDEAQTALERLSVGTAANR
jgi:tetratricopeptide (TPR) repeat protein